MIIIRRRLLRWYVYALLYSSPSLFFLKWRFLGFSNTFISILSRYRPESNYNTVVFISLPGLTGNAFQLLEHLPHSVSGVGDELARGDPDNEPFNAVGKVKPSELLGFVVVVRAYLLVFFTLARFVKPSPRCWCFLFLFLSLSWITSSYIKCGVRSIFFCCFPFCTVCRFL